MIDYFFQMGISNACLSLALGIVAMVVGARTKRPQLAYMLWLLVFIKLLTPPIVTIPIVTIPAQGETAVAINDHSSPVPLLSDSRQLNTEASLWSKLGSATWKHARVWLPPIWLLGSVVVFAWSTVRVCCFSRLLAKKSEVAPQELQTVAAKIARRLKLNTIPTICTTSARISPMVWWTGGKVRIVIPTTLLDQMDAQQSQWILAHELAHVRRRDYLVRWLEWLACVLFWWNPVVWWAQRNLRAMEEICCDELVISCLNPKPKSYANSLLSAVEFLARPALRPPAMASEINSGGVLERRFKMIVSETPKRSNSRWLQACVLLYAMVVLPLGIASAQDYKAVERRLGEAVSNGELSLEQAGVMMGTLKKEAAKSKSDANLESIWKKPQAKVKTGELTEEQATAKMSAVKTEAAKSKSDANLESIWKKPQAKVKTGELTKEQATAKSKSDTNLESIWKKLHAKVKAGELTEEQAAAKMSAIKTEAAKSESDTNLESIWKKPQAKVKAGELTKEQATAKMSAIKKEAAKSKSDTNLESTWKKPQAMVKTGELTKEQATAKMSAIKKEAATKDKDGD